MSNNLHKSHYMTVVTGSDKPGHHTFWFGRADMKDNLRPIKIEAKDGKDAWAKLGEHVKCSTSS